MLYKILSFIIFVFCITSVSAMEIEYYNEEEISQARVVSNQQVRVEEFFQKYPQSMWISCCDQEYDYKSQTQGQAHHKQAVIVKLKKQETVGCDFWGWLALFPHEGDSLKKIYKDNLMPEFSDFFGTAFNAYIKFYGNTNHNFLVLDFMDAGAEQKGKGYVQFATNAFIKFAKDHTNAEYILCDARNHRSMHISKKFGFELDASNTLWTHFKKGVQQPFVLHLKNKEI